MSYPHIRILYIEIVYEPREPEFARNLTCVAHPAGAPFFLPIRIASSAPFQSPVFIIRPAGTRARAPIQKQRL